MSTGSRELEAIVEALAKTTTVLPSGDMDWNFCIACSADEFPSGTEREIERHEPDCPWRRAVEWVEAPSWVWGHDCEPTR